MKLKRNTRRYLRLKFSALIALLGALLMAMGIPAVAQEADSINIVIDDELLIRTDTTLSAHQIELIEEADFTPPEAVAPQGEPVREWQDTLAIISGHPKSIYASPASWTYSEPWAHGMWINAAVLTGAFVTTLFVLETLPEDATAWNRAEINNVPFYKRWFRNIFKKGPEWDHDKFIFNYVLHPYAGAAYFMGARSCGYNFWQSLLFSAAISTIGWEFGVEACMERPSIQDIFITPIVGSLMGEGFYRLKRKIVDRDYYIFGSPVLGHIIAFFLDPVNEIMGLLNPGKCRSIGPGCIHSEPLLIPSPLPGESSAFGIRFAATF